MDSVTPFGQKRGISTTAVVVVVIIVVLIAGGAYFLSKITTPQPTVVQEIQPTPVEAVAVASPEVSATPTGPVKEFTVDGTNFKLDPSTITVKKGDTVKITFKDDGGMHNLTIDGYNVSTSNLTSGGSEALTFVADKTGTFAFYCSIDSHRAKGMEGKLIVK